MKHSDNDARILAAFSEPRTVQDVVRITGLKATTVSSILGRMLHTKALVSFGAVGGLKTYGPPEMRIAPIAQPNRGFEFRPLVRDPFAHMKLAMVTRT